MPRDYKHRAQRKKSRDSVSPWTGLFAGLAIGLFVALLVFLKMQPDTQPRVAAVAAEVAVEPSRVTVNTVSKEVKAKSVLPKPRFDFYTLLPEMEVVIPEQEITGRTEAGIKQVEEPGTYHLQVGSFRSLEQADRLKAELTLLGLEMSLQKVTINNTDTYHRVRVGPFQDLDTLNRARQLLNKQDIEIRLIRLAE